MPLRKPREGFPGCSPLARSMMWHQLRRDVSCVASAEPLTARPGYLESRAPDSAGASADSGVSTSGGGGEGAGDGALEE